MHAAFRVDEMASKHQLRRASIAVVSPRREPWHLTADFSEEGLPVNSVEGVGEIEFEEHCVGIGLMAQAPLSSDVYAHFCAQSLPNPYLKRSQIAARLVLVGGAQYFKR